MFFAGTTHQGTLLLRNGTFADPASGQVLVNRSMLITDGVITACESAIAEPHDATVVDLNGALVTPGLIDAHVHLTMDASSTPEQWVDATPAEREIVIRENLARSLAAGVTTVRDVGSKLDVLSELRELEASGEAGPTVLASGPVLTVPEGHGAAFGAITDLGTVAEVLDRAVAGGVDCVKLMSSGGFASPHTDVHQTQYSDAEFDGIVQAAHARGLKVACHAHATEAIEQCLRFGVDSIEHGSYMTAEQVARLGKSGIFWVPTVAPGALVPDLPPAALDRVDRRCASLRLGLDLGVTVAAGTDAGIRGVPNGSLPYELDVYIANGMTTMQALQSATTVGADLLGLAGRKGCLTVGADADLLVFTGALTDADFSFHDPAVVLRGGSVVRAEQPFAAAFARQ